MSALLPFYVVTMRRLKQERIFKIINMDFYFIAATSEFSQYIAGKHL